MRSQLLSMNKPKSTKSMFLEEQQIQMSEIQKASAALASNKKKAQEEYQPFNPALQSSNLNVASQHNKQQVHKEYKDRIELLETSFRNANQSNLSFKKQNQQLKTKIQKLQRDLQEKGIFLARAQAMYSDQLNRAIDYKKQMQKLAANLRTTSTFHINAVTAYQSMKNHYENNVSHEKEAMGKLVHFYQQQLYPSDTGGEKMEMSQLIKLNEAMKADTDALLNKIVERQEYYQKQMRLNDEELMRQREQGQFGYEMCAKIQQTLSEYAKNQEKFYKRFVEISEQNERLRKQLKQLSAENDKIYEDYCELKMVDDCSKKYEQELKKIIKAYESKIFEYHNQITIRNEENEQQFRNKLLTLQHTITKKSQQLKIKDQAIQTIKAQLKQAQVKNKNLLSNIQEYSKKLDQQKENNNSKKLELQKENSDSHIQYISNLSKISTFEPLFTKSEILDENLRAFKQSLIKLMQATYSSSFPNKKIAKTILFFRRNEASRNFGQYLKDSIKNESKQKLNILLIVRIDQKRFIGGFAPLTHSPEKKRHNSQPAFLFTYSQGKEINKYGALYKTYEVLYALTYSQNKLMFGNNELSIRNGSKQKYIQLSNPFGTRYYSQIGDTSKISYQSMEMFNVIFENA